MLEPDKKYLSIREIAERVDVPVTKLRYWEKKFSQIKPERHSNMRKYSQQDVELIKKIKDLLYNKRFTIEGAVKYLKVDRRKKINNGDLFQNAGNNGIVAEQNVIIEIKKELQEVLELLEK